LTRLFRFIVPIACFLIFQGVYAIDISFSASSGGGSVGITDSYDVDDRVGVSGRSSASFGDGVSMTNVNSLSGSGDANVNQFLYGSGWGADYVAEYALRTSDASSIEGSGSVNLVPDSGGISRSVTTTGSSETISELFGTQGGDFAVVESRALGADISATQSFAVGQSVSASQSMSAEGLYAEAYGRAMDNDGNRADTIVKMQGGIIVADQVAYTGDSAFVTQRAEIEGDYVWAKSEAEDNEGNIALTTSEIQDGSLLTDQGAAADDDAMIAGQYSEIEGELGWAIASMRDDKGNRAYTMTNMVGLHGDGTLVTDQRVKTGNGVQADQISAVDADRCYAMAEASDGEGNLAQTVATYTSRASLVTDQVAIADDGAIAGQITEIEGLYGITFSQAADTDCHHIAYTETQMNNGTLSTVGGAGAGNGAVAIQQSFVDAWWAHTESYAMDTGDRYVEIQNEVENGTLDTFQWVETTNSAEGYQKTEIVGDFAWALCEAKNTGRGYLAYVDNRVNGNASLKFEGGASVNDSEARAHQVSHAEGDEIRFRWNTAGLCVIEKPYLAGSLDTMCEIYQTVYVHSMNFWIKEP